jgi:hypothetical protein
MKDLIAGALPMGTTKHPERRSARDAHEQTLFAETELMICIDDVRRREHRRSRAHEPDDLLGDSAGRFFGHIVPAASKHATAHVSRYEAHRVDQRRTDSDLCSEGEHRYGSFRSARARLCAIPSGLRMCR